MVQTYVEIFLHRGIINVNEIESVEVLPNN